MAARKKTARKTKKTARKRVGTAAQFHRLIMTDAAARKRLYGEDGVGRVRCYKYKYGKSRPNPATQKKIEKLTKGAIKAPWV